MTMRWYHYETRFMNLLDPSLHKIQASIQRLPNDLTHLFFQLLDLASSIHIYLNRPGIQKFGNLYHCIRATSS
jgi:hypothetical protein